MENGTALQSNTTGQSIASMEEAAIVRDTELNHERFQQLLLSEIETIENVNGALLQIEEILFDAATMGRMTEDDLMKLYKAGTMRKKSSQDFMLRFMELASKEQIEKAWLQKADVLQRPQNAPSPKVDEIKNLLQQEIRKRLEEGL